MSALAIFGGTFNPPHKGHKHLLETVMKSVDLDKVIVMPDRLPPHKAADALVSEEDRYNMCLLTFGETDKVSVSDWELKREGKSYSYYTVKHFHKLYKDDELYFIVGSDMLISFDKWYRNDDILKMCSLLCITRSRSDTESARKKAESFGEKVRFIEAEPIEISSSELRSMIINGNFTELTCYLDENVIKYIKEKNLYR